MDKQSLNKKIQLNDRALFRISGADAFSFLQNLITQDMRLIENDTQRLIYSGLLSPQGNILHDFFIFSDGAGKYIIDCDTRQKDTFIRRLTMYKLRSKVDISDVNDMHVFYSQNQMTDQEMCFADPRLSSLGYRIYTPDQIEASGTLTEYADSCIAQGIPVPDAMQLEKDYISDLNLDFLNAVSFDKGCFVGQELTARVHHRGLVKRRLFIFYSTENVAAGKKFVLQGSDNEVGDVRCADSTGLCGLCLLKTNVHNEHQTVSVQAQHISLTISKPSFLPD